MAIEQLKFNEWSEALSFLRAKALSNHEHLFRGHTSTAHRLQTSWQRYSKIAPESWMSDIQQTITNFWVGLARNNLLPFESDNIQDRMEYGRHHGIPTPSLDFTRSPYIALYFALSALNGASSTGRIDPVVYILDSDRLAEFWSENFGPTSPPIDAATFRREFLNPPRSFFDRGFPSNVLQLFPFPSKTNHRMQRQLGALLYDTMNYAALNVNDLENYLESIDDTAFNSRDSGSAVDRRVLYKVFLKEEWAEAILSELELVGINGGYLYGNAEGVAQDVRNSYFYSPRTNQLRDISFIPPTL
jgi:hypothetical protein